MGAGPSDEMWEDEIPFLNEHGQRCLRQPNALPNVLLLDGCDAGQSVVSFSRMPVAFAYLSQYPRSTPSRTTVLSGTLRCDSLHYHWRLWSGGTLAVNGTRSDYRSLAPVRSAPGTEPGPQPTQRSTFPFRKPSAFRTQCIDADPRHVPDHPMLYGTRCGSVPSVRGRANSARCPQSPMVLAALVHPIGAQERPISPYGVPIQAWDCVVSAMQSCDAAGVASGHFKARIVRNPVIRWHCPAKGARTVGGAAGGSPQ